MQEKGQPLPKFGEWDVNDPASAEGFTVIFYKAKDEKKTGGNPESPTTANANFKQGVDHVKPQAVSYMPVHCCSNYFDIIEQIFGPASAFCTCLLLGHLHALVLGFVACL